MNRRESETLMHIGNWFVEVFSFSYWSIMVVLARHDLEVRSIPSLLIFNKLSLRTVRIYWFSSFPVIFVAFLKKHMVTNSIRWSLINISYRISLLSGTTHLIKVFLIVSMVRIVVLRISNMRSIIPGGSSSISRQVNPRLKSIHFILF